jgi:hypothetical protein
MRFKIPGKSFMMMMMMMVIINNETRIFKTQMDRNVDYVNS